MDFLANLGNSELAIRQERDKLLDSNVISAEYGLSLTPHQALALVQEKNRLLQSAGRVELQNDVIAKLIEAFAPSDYMSSFTWEETLHELVRIFYECRGEFRLDESDDDLIDWMALAFEEPCCGSLELLAGKALDRKLRGYKGMEAD